MNKKVEKKKKTDDEDEEVVDVDELGAEEDIADADVADEYNKYITRGKSKDEEDE